jgi:hypothetical protein
MPGRAVAEDFPALANAARQRLEEALCTVCAIGESLPVDDTGASIRELRHGARRTKDAASRPPGAMIHTVHEVLHQVSPLLDTAVGKLEGELRRREAESRRRAADLAWLQDLLPRMTDTQGWIHGAVHDTRVQLAASAEYAAAVLRELRNTSVVDDGGSGRPAGSAWRTFRSRTTATEFTERAYAEAVARFSTALAESVTAVGRRTGHGMSVLSHQTSQAEATVRRLFGLGWPNCPPATPAPPEAGSVRDLQLTIWNRVLATVRPPQGRLNAAARVKAVNGCGDLIAAVSGRCFLVSHDEVCEALAVAFQECLESADRQFRLFHEQLWTGPSGEYLRAWQTTQDYLLAGCGPALGRAVTEVDEVVQAMRNLARASNSVAEVEDRVQVLCTGTTDEVSPLVAWALQQASDLTGVDLTPSGELRIVVVAAMKAGKSTLVNAIAGSEVLPARAAAMTCLPVRVELVNPAERREPVLRVGDELRRCLETAGRVLRDARSAPGESRWVDRHAHLADLLVEVRSGRQPGLPASIEGEQPVRAALTYANDLLRLALLVCPEETKPLLHTVEPPSVQVPRTGMGRTPVVLVDTPGPDEVGTSEELSLLVEREVGRAHAAIVVLDFTRLESTAGMQTLRTLKHRPFLFAEAGAAVVNRIDQRRTGDRDADAVRRFVDHHLGHRDLRILETSARQALAATTFLSAREAAREGAVPDLLQACYPAGASDEAGMVTVARLIGLAERLLDRSGIRAVRQVIDDVAVDALRSAARATVRRALLELNTQLAAEPPSSPRVDQLATTLAWSLVIAGHKPPQECEVAS